MMSRVRIGWLTCVSTRSYIFLNAVFRSVRSLLLACCLVCAMLPPLLMAQAQGGEGSWSVPIDITQSSDAHHTQYGILACDPYQHVHIFWADNVDSGETTPAIFYRNNALGNWSVPRAIIATPQSIIKLKVAISEKAGTIHLIWADDIANARVYHSFAPLAQAYDARQWSSPEPLIDQTDSSAIQIEAIGIVHLVYSQTSPDGMQHTVFYIKSTDDGKTWSTPSVVANPYLSVPSHVQTEIAVDDNGRVHVGISIRSIEYGRDSIVGYVRSLDNGNTWSDFQVIQDVGTAFQGVAWIAPYAFGKDEVFLTWHDPRRMYKHSVDGGETWSTPAEIMPLGAAFGGTNPIVQDNASNFYIAIASGAGVYVLQWNGDTWVLPQKVESRRLDPHGQNMTVCQGNQLHLVYYDNYEGSKGDLVDAENRVWWTMRELDASRIEPRTIDAARPMPTDSTIHVNTEPAENATLEPVILMQKDIPPIDFGASPAPSSPAVKVILLSLTPVLVLIVGVFVLKRR